MARLPTQPSPAPLARPVPLRSGFVALPLSGGKVHLFARIHHHDADSDPSPFGASSSSSSSKPSPAGTEIFVTGFPHGTTVKGLKSALAKIWGETSSKVREVRMLPSPVASAQETGEGAVVTLLQKELATESAAEAEGADDRADTAMPLFDPSLSSASSPLSSSSAPYSAIATFDSAPPFPPAPYAASTPLTLPVAPSFLSCARARHALARPHRSLVTSHVDAWMRAFDARRAASLPIGYSAERAQVEREQAAREAKKLARQAGRKGAAAVAAAAATPAPGSAAEALARHAALQARRADPNYNPDELDEGEWTTVSRGGKHGKSLLPAGVQPTVQGYGGVTVKIAGKKRGRTAVDGAGNGGPPPLDAGIKKIVGDGFYRFNQAEGRRKELANLKARFEEDKRRVDRMRNGGSGRGGRGGRGGKSQGDAAGGRGGRFQPY